jgi:hypothetical protein
MKRNSVRSLFTLIFLTLIFGLALGAVSAMAESTSFEISATQLNIRGEGTKEAIGPVILTATSGTPGGVPSVIKANSAITFAFSAPVANAGGLTNANLSCSPGVCTGVTVSSPGALGVSSVTLTFAFDSGPIRIGDTIELGGVRVNANAQGVGNLTVNLSAIVPPAFLTTNGIGFINNGVTVGIIKAPSFTVALSTGPNSILTCSPGAQTFGITVTENFSTAFTSESDEAALAPGAPMFPVTNGLQLLVTIHNLPAGAVITAEAPAYPTGQTSLAVALDPSSSQVVTSTGADITFLYDVSTSSSSASKIEGVTLNFTPSYPAGLPPTTIGPVTALVSLAPTDQTKTPAFAPGNTEPFSPPTPTPAPVINISNCVTYILLPWVTNFQVATSTDPRGHYDSGIVITNTSTDPFGAPGSALPQNGNCVLTMYPDDGSTSTTYTTATANSGTSLVFTASMSFPGKSGYVVGFCNFQNAHSYVYIVDNAGLGPAHTASGYLGLVIPNVTKEPRNPAGFGFGESLTH